MTRHKPKNKSNRARFKRERGDLIVQSLAQAVAQIVADVREPTGDIDDAPKEPPAEIAPLRTDSVVGGATTTG